MDQLLNHFVEDLEFEYEHHPRLIISIIITLSYFVILIQSYLALPRDLIIVFLDTWEVLLFIGPLLFIVLRLKLRNLLIFGIFYFIFGFNLAFLRFPAFIKPEYATISFLSAIWFIGDWFNYKIFKKSLLPDLLKGNYYIAGGLFLSTVFLGSLIEFLNAPVGLWWYRFPFPSLEIFGVPIFLAAFGWFPWICAMFVLFYPFAFKKPKKSYQHLPKSS